MPRGEGRGIARIAGAALLAALTVGLPGCGGGGGGGTTSSTPVPQRRQIHTVNFTVEGIFDAQAVGVPFDVARSEFSTSATGTLEAQCDWTFASNDIDIAIYRGSCTFDQFFAAQCSTLVESVSPTAKPERVSAPNAPAGFYTLMIANFGATKESGVCQIFLTS